MNDIKESNNEIFEFSKDESGFEKSIHFLHPWHQKTCKL